MSSILLLSERLAATFASETVRAALLFAFAALILKLMPRLSASIRSLVWTAVLLIATGLPFLPSTNPAQHPISSAHVLHFAPAWSVVIAAIWLLASTFRAASLFLNTLQLRTIWHSAKPISGAPAATVQTFAGQSRTAALCLSQEVTRPSVIGFFSARILIPATLYPRLSAPELDHIVLHEMEHLRRYDDWRNLLQKLALIVFPLNPALFWIDRRLSLEREMACDESVLTATRAPRSYASCLVRLAEETVLGRPVSLALGAWERRSELARRVENILTFRELPRHGRLAATALVAATLTAGATLAHTPGFVDFYQPARTIALAAPPRAASSLYQEAAFRADPVQAFRSARKPRPTAVEAVAHLQAKQSIPVLRPVLSRPRALPASRARRVRCELTPAPLYRVTTWVVSYNGLVDQVVEPRVTFTVFSPAGFSGGAPQLKQVLSPEARSAQAVPAASSFLFISL